jgi:hypothetical protein
MARRIWTLRLDTTLLVVAWSLAAGACGSSSNTSSFSRGQDGGRDGALPIVGSLGGETGAASASLYFEPAAATVTVDGTSSPSVAFTLKRKGPNGSAQSVVADSVVFDRPDLGTVMGGEPVRVTAPSGSGLGGTGHVHAIYRGTEAIAALTVVVHVVDYGSGLNAGSPAVQALTGAHLGVDPASAITPLLYPYDKTVWPLGLTSPLVMWNAPETGDVYRLHYEEQNYTFDGYYTLGALPGQLRLDQTTWDRITASNNAPNGPDPLTFALSRWDHTSGAAYATSSQAWTVAPQSLRGAIYYWAASQDAQGVRRGRIERFQPGTGAEPQTLNNGKCMGCHAVNAQGTVLVADVDDLNASEYTGGGANTDPSTAPYGNWTRTRPWASFDIANVQPDAGVLPTLETTMFGADLALTPDGKYLVFGGPTTVAAGGFTASSPVVGSKYISLATTATGTVITTSGLDQVNVDPNMGMMMPAFSPDGTKLAVVEAQFSADNVIPMAANPSQGVSESIAYLDFDAAGPSFGPTLHKLVDGSNAAFSSVGRGLAYPSFSPDGTSVAFHSGTYSTGCDPSVPNPCVDTTPDDGNLFVVALPSGTPIRLAATDDPPNESDRNASLEPTFNPEPRGGYSWVVFTSMRNWGNQPWPSDVTATTPVNGKRRLWVAAVDESIGTVDPSHPAIYLEGQDDTPNMRGFWALAACIATPSHGGDAACTNGFECCSGFCENGQCAGVATVTCTGVGGACVTAADCCNSPVVTCDHGSCVPPAPP